MRLSLRTKLSLIFFILISVSLIALGVFSYYQSSSSQKTTAEQNLKEITKLNASNIDNKLSAVSNSVEFMSSNSDILNIVTTPNDETKLKGFNYLTQIQKKYSNEIEMLIVVDKSGKAIVSSSNVQETTDLSDREYFQKCIGGTPAKSDVIISKLTENPVVAIAYPLIENNAVIGVIVGTINFGTISQIAKDTKIGNGGYSYMLNKEGLFIYHPKSEKILKENLYETATGDLKSLTEIMKSGKPGSGEYVYEGVRKYVTFLNVNGWTLATTDNYSDYMGAALKIRLYTIIFTLLAILLAMLISYIFLTKSVISPIKQLEKLMAEAGSGDLTVVSNISTRDEIEELGNSFNKMIKSQSNIIERVRTGSEDLSAGSEEMAAASEEITASIEQVTSSMQEVALGTENQKNAIVETSQVLVQLSSLINIAQNKAHTANNNSKKSMAAAQNGRNKVKDTVNAIQTINEATEETSNILKVLEDLSKKVGGIITTINSLSDQTNLLALNAAIEAARAGEHGKGFSVVADEVRKLSEQSALGANEISKLVSEMVKQIELAVKSMANGKVYVENGVEVVKETDESFISIINSVEQIVNDVEQIVNVTKDEVANSDKIVGLIDTIATLAESSSANSQEVAVSAEEQTASVQSLSATAQQTSSLAYELNNLVEKFKI